MKIFTVLLGYLAVTRFDHTVFGSPAGLLAGREGDVAQQRNDAFIKLDSTQALETRKGDPPLFPLAVELILSAVGSKVQSRKGSTDDNSLRTQFMNQVVSTCNQTWRTWNWAVVASDELLSHNIYGQTWGSLDYQLELTAPYNLSILWFQEAQLNLLGSPPHQYANAPYIYSQPYDSTDQLDLFFLPSDPKVIIEKGIKDDVDRILNKVGSAAASLGGSDQERREAFTAWTISNVSQHWPEFNWVVESNDHLIKPDGVIGADWQATLYKLGLVTPVPFHIYWLKSGMIVNEGPGGYYHWAYTGFVDSEPTWIDLPKQFGAKQGKIVYFVKPPSPS